jgi:hypothetical protein
MKTEEIIECLQLRCEATRFNDYLLVNALSRLRTLQSIGKQRDELIEALDYTASLIEESGGRAETARQAIAKAKGE